MSAKKCRRDTVIWLFTSAIMSAFVECRHGLERLIISNNHIIKSDVYITLKHSQISLDIYQHISYHVQNQKKEENNISTMKTYQMPNK